MNRQEIMNIIPHRDGMLLVDEAEICDGVSHGRFTVKGDEWFLKGHFPENPIVPGVILCEMMAQSICVLLADDKGMSEATPYFTGFDNVRFRSQVHPGDTFETEGVITKIKKPFYFASAKGFVNGRLCVSADFSFAVIKN